MCDEVGIDHDSGVGYLLQNKGERRGLNLGLDRIICSGKGYKKLNPPTPHGERQFGFPVVCFIVDHLVLLGLKDIVERFLSFIFSFPVEDSKANLNVPRERRWVHRGSTYYEARAQLGNTRLQN